MSKAQSKSYAKEQRRLLLESIEQSHIQANLKVIAEFRHFHIFKRQHPIPRDALQSAIDDYVGKVTGDRTALETRVHSIPQINEAAN